MCKYLLKKRKFPRDIYSWFITSYLRLFGFHPRGRVFSRDAVSTLRFFFSFFLHDTYQLKEKYGWGRGKRTCLSRQNTSLLYKHLHVTTKKKKKSIPHSGIKMHTRNILAEVYMTGIPVNA